MNYWNVPLIVNQTNPLVVAWFWRVYEGHGEQVNHNCGPDCECWTAVQQLRGVTEINKKSA